MWPGKTAILSWAVHRADSYSPPNSVSDLPWPYTLLIKRDRWHCYPVLVFSSRNSCTHAQDHTCKMVPAISFIVVTLMATRISVNGWVGKMCSGHQPGWLYYSKRGWIRPRVLSLMDPSLMISRRKQVAEGVAYFPYTPGQRVSFAVSSPEWNTNWNYCMGNSRNKQP